MEVKQIYELMNNVTTEILGKSDLVKEDLSNVVEVGTEIFGATEVDGYVKSLVNHRHKTVQLTCRTERLFYLLFSK